MYEYRDRRGGEPGDRRERSGNRRRVREKGKF